MTAMMMMTMLWISWISVDSVDSFCHGPMGPQPEAARENIYATLYV